MTEDSNHTHASELTQLFIRIKAGDEQARNQLTDYLYHELRRIAATRRNSFKHHQTLNTTALVNETWLKLQKANLAYQDKNHFLSVAALAMRQILLDDSRRKSFLKQHGLVDSTATGQLTANPHQAEAEWLHHLDLILRKLEKHHPRLALLFNLKFFCGLTLAELADYFQVSEKTAQRDWQKVKTIVANTMHNLSEQP